MYYVYLQKICFDYFDHHFYFPAQLVGGFTLSDLLDKSWSQVSSLFPPRYVPSIFVAHRVQHSHCSSIHRMLQTHALALSASHILCKKKSLRVRGYVHSVRIELAKLILVGTRITYQATGDAGIICTRK